MNTVNQNVSAQAIDQVFKFCIRGDSVIRTTVTIHAKNLDGAWNWLRILFPGADLSDTEVQHGGHHSLSERAVQT